MRFGTRVWGAGKVLLLVGALGVTFLVCFGISMRVALQAGQVRVPDLHGKTVNEATQLLRRLELGLNSQRSLRADDKIPAGQVVQQDPPAGVEARPRRTVRVWVSSGPRTNVVPGLTGQTERTARTRLEQDGLELTSLSEFQSPDYPADAVVSQEPAASARAPRVSLLVNRGDQAAVYLMPDVTGMDGARVEGLIRTQGFRVEVMGSQPYPGIPPGTVVRQQPAAGGRIGPADAISLEVSK
jgi:beta-lactam-binding protein with PASTA domain